MSATPPPDREALYPCVGICLPDDDEAYCIGCGRPWGEPVVLPSAPADGEMTPPPSATTPSAKP